MTSPAAERSAKRSKKRALSPDFCPSKSHLNVSNGQRPSHTQSWTCEGARMAGVGVLASPVQEDTLEKGRMQVE